MLIIQDPTNEQSTFLLESLLEAFGPAQKVVGAFAFASAAGVRLFAEDEAFQNVASQYPVDIVVGTDAVTNNRALDSLTDVARSFPNVTMRAFLNPRPEALFHPKFCWTKHSDGGQLITGSGNLTEGGLLGNWEAYSIEDLSPAGVAAVETAWNRWKTTHATALLPLDNPEVRKRVSENNVMAREGDLPTLVASPASQGEDPATTQLMSNSAAVLIAEIPRSGNRWKQANFDLDSYVNFFGAQEGVNRMMVFRHVRADGSMADYERNRPPVTVKSRNFRFELDAAAGLDYPTNGRPIGVFIHMATRTFFYRLLLPGDDQYDVVRRILDRRSGEGEVRRLRMTVEQLRREWPRAPFWRLPATI